MEQVGRHEDATRAENGDGHRRPPDDLGRVVGDSVTSLLFRCRLGREVYVGDLLVADDPTTGNRYFLRVTNVRHGADAAGPDWMHRTAGNMMAMDDAGEDHRLHEADRRLYKLGVCTALGYVRGSDGTFRKMKNLPPHFAGVRRATADDYAFLKAYMGDVEVGHLRSGEDVVPLAVGIDGGKAFPYHVGVFATTGMGKSNLMKVLAGSVLEAGRYGLLLIDPHGEYFDGGEATKRGLIHHPDARRLRVYTARDLKNRDARYHRLTLSSHEVDIHDLKQLFEFSSAQSDFLDAARSHFGDGWFSELADKHTLQLQNEVPGKFFEGTINVVKRKLHRLARNGLVHADPNVTVTKAILDDLRNGRVVLVDSGGLLEAEELLVATVLARTIFDANKAAFGDASFETIPPVLIAIEEAQRVLGRGQRQGSHNVFAQIAREGRKFKTGLCAVTQQPKLVDPEVISQFNTLFILGLADARDRQILTDSAKQDVASLENEIQTLMPGEALITSPYAPFAIPCAVHLYERRLEDLATKAPRREAAPKASSAGFD